MFGRDAERMMDMWMGLLDEIENYNRIPTKRFTTRKQQIGSVEDRDESIVLSADLPGIEKKDIELKIDSHSIAFSAETEERNYDFGQSFDFELNPDEVKATFNNGVLDVVVKKAEGTQGKTIEIE
tara:strand:- start:544 stop:918 length:375 start_codon:yes stop_codon:yes gene_type:complete